MLTGYINASLSAGVRAADYETRVSFVLGEALDFPAGWQPEWLTEAADNIDSSVGVAEFTDPLGDGRFRTLRITQVRTIPRPAAVKAAAVAVSKAVLFSADAARYLTQGVLQYERAVVLEIEMYKRIRDLSSAARNAADLAVEAATAARDVDNPAIAQHGRYLAIAARKASMAAVAAYKTLCILNGRGIDAAGVRDNRNHAYREISNALELFLEQTGT